jgi:glycosyltransferase involved in cell wall biosynthesis
MFPEVSAVFPAYNEEENIRPSLSQARKVLARYFREWEIIVVNDGSTDNTKIKLEQLLEEDARIKVISHPQNLGYGQALRTGFALARFGLVFFSDSDGQFDLEEMGLLLPYLDQAEIVTGYRLKRADPFHRNLNAWLYNRLVRFVFGLKVRDINCAFKFIKRKVLETVSLESRGALINAELLYKARKNKFKIIEVGVHHYPRRFGSQTGAKPVVVLRMFAELLKWRMKWGGIV